MNANKVTTTNKLSNSSIKVLFSAAEADPFVKVGGLGDVAYALPQALRKLELKAGKFEHIDARLFLPYHSIIKQNGLTPALLFDFEVPYPHGSILAQAYFTEVEQLPVYLISGNPIPAGAPVYSTDNYMDGLKYIFFSLACLALAEKLGWKMDILHANDWHTAIEVYALSYLRLTTPFFADTKSILTIHNLPYMGGGAEIALQDYGIPPAQDPDLPVWGRNQPLPMGISVADHITAVSPGYAAEIQTPDFGCGLEKYLSKKAHKLTGIINGLDTNLWNPSNDKLIPQAFDENTLYLREANKKSLLQEMGFSKSLDSPLFIMIGRMDPQKGVDLAIQSLSNLMSLDWKCVFLGTGNPDLEHKVKELEENAPDKIRAITRFDSRLSRWMYAGADFLLMPSRYEPCGLAQMIAMRYGCIPIARATGGLRDTINDIDSSASPTGFLFDSATSEALSDKIKTAISLFPNKSLMQQLQKNGMQRDFSWELSAKKYADLYLRLLGTNL